MILTKNQTRLFHAMSDINGEYIEEAFSSASRPVIHILKRVSVVAATLVLLFVIPQVVHLIQSVTAPPSIYVSPVPENAFFAITAQATDGTDSSLTLNNKLFSSSIPGLSEDKSALFPDAPEDMGLFDLYVHLPAPSLYYTLIIEYNGVVTYNGIVPSEDVNLNDDIIRGKGDKHITVFHSSVPNVPDKGCYHVKGWFEEPTDLSLKLVRDEDGVILQEQILRVEYISESNTYALTVTQDTIFFR